MLMFVSLLFRVAVPYFTEGKCCGLSIICREAAKGIVSGGSCELCGGTFLHRPAQETQNLL